LDWQIDCAAQICSALMPALSGVRHLRLDFDGLMIPTEWDNGEIDGTTWHELLRSFMGVNRLHICVALSQELSRALQVDEVGLDLGLLPNLQEIQFYETVNRLFGSFIHARIVAGRPVRLSITREADHLNNYLQWSLAPHGNVARSLNWSMTQNSPNNQTVYTATAMLYGVSLGEGKGPSRGWAKRAAAEMALSYLAQNGIPDPHG